MTRITAYPGDILCSYRRNFYLEEILTLVGKFYLSPTFCLVPQEFLRGVIFLSSCLLVNSNFKLFFTLCLCI